MEIEGAQAIPTEEVAMDVQKEESSAPATDQTKVEMAKPASTSVAGLMAARYVSEVVSDSTMKARIPGVFTLLRCGCCELCAFRFLGQQTFSLYREPLSVLRHVIDTLWESLSEAERGADDWRARSQATEAEACGACLGILQKAMSEAALTALLADMRKGMDAYEFSNYSLTITLPASTVTRQYALHYHLRAVHKELEEFEDINDIVGIKEALKWILGYEIRQRLHLSFSRESLFHVGIKFKHPETETEHHFLYDISSADFRPPRKKAARQHHYQQQQQQPRDSAAAAAAAPLSAKEEALEEGVSLNCVTKALRKVPMSVFLKYGAVPPTALKEAAALELSFFHDSIYLAGRYAKYSRELSQSPWVADGTRVSEASVQELITGPLDPHFRSHEMRFSSSGREDIDVRMLGEGRPFVLEVVDPHRTMFSPEQYAEMQREINDSTHLVHVRDLQRIAKEQSTMVQAGEEDKKKSYRCVVWLSKTISPADLVPLSAIKNLVVDQTTPIRVLHRRTLMLRKRTIYEMRAEYISPHFMTLELTTQAGTYVKEFVHGDLGRTRPNLGLLLGCDADILQLDVVGIELDFPPRLAGQPAVSTFKLEPTPIADAKPQQRDDPPDAGDAPQEAPAKQQS